MFETQDGEQWPGGVLRVNWRGSNFSSGAVTADRLDLEAIRLDVGEDLALPRRPAALRVRCVPAGGQGGHLLFIEDLLREHENEVRACLAKGAHRGEAT